MFRTSSPSRRHRRHARRRREPCAGRIGGRRDVGTFDVPSIGSIVVQPDGGILGTDCGNAQIYRVSPAGAVSIFAGAGGGGFDNGYSGDGGPALDAHFGCVYGIIDDGAGGVLVADHLNDVIRRIDRRGIVSTVAGSGPRFTWSKGPWMPNLKEVGDGGPAQDALLDAPTGIALDGSGNTYIVDRDHDAVRRVGVDGTIVTVAGTGQGGYSGDGGPATQAKLNRPLGVLPLRGGAFLIADENNARVRRVDADGRITTFAGTGAPRVRRRWRPCDRCVPAERLEPRADWRRVARRIAGRVPPRSDHPPRWHNPTGARHRRGSLRRRRGRTRHVDADLGAVRGDPRRERPTARRGSGLPGRDPRQRRGSGSHRRRT